jgi:hypothetical protein
MVHQPCPRLNKLKNISLKGHKIISLPGVPTCLEPAMFIIYNNNNNNNTVFLFMPYYPIFDMAL